MRIACLQFAPQVGDIDNNLNRADAVLSKANQAELDELDLLVLPELAFTGYNFKSLQEISPFLEPSGSGISSLWARTTALKYNCNVLLGYPEKVDVTPIWPASPEYYNSSILINGDGETVANYRKSFLYYVDEKWALEGRDGFFDSYISGLGNTAIGICSDINPYKLEAPWLAFEFAFHVLHVRANLVILSMAWPTDEDSRHYSRMPQEPDMDTVTYWVQRLEPLIRAESSEEIIVVFCNRTGKEDDLTYAGTSAVIGIKGGEVSVYGLLGRGVKELLVVDTDLPAFAKLVQRSEPDSNVESAATNPGLLLPSRPSAPPPPALLQDLKSEGSSSRWPSSSPEVEKKQSRTTKGGSSTQPGLDQLKSPSEKPPHQRAETYINTTPEMRSPTEIASPSSPTSTSGTRVKAMSPKIEIPNSAFRSNPPSAMDVRSSEADSPVVDTPTAPSPTPSHMRPKLFLPTTESNFHHVLTPYPTDENTRARPFIFDGSVTVTTDILTPATPYLEFFRETSSDESKFYWVPSQQALQTPVDNRKLQNSGSPVSRMRPGFQSSSGQSSGHMPPRPFRSPASGNNKQQSDSTDKAQTTRNPTPIEPQPPATLPFPTRNMSRSRAPRVDAEPLKSSLVEKPSQNPERKTLAHRPGSRADRTESPVLERGKSPFTLDGSPFTHTPRGRETKPRDPVGDERLHSTSRASIPIAASPSLFKTENQEDQLQKQPLSNHQPQNLGAVEKGKAPKASSISRPSSRRGHHDQNESLAFHQKLRSRSLGGMDSGARRVRATDFVGRNINFTGGNIIARPQTSIGNRCRDGEPKLSPTALSDPTGISTIERPRGRSSALRGSSKSGNHEASPGHRPPSARSHRSSANPYMGEGDDEIIATISKITNDCPVHARSIQGAPIVKSSDGTMYAITFPQPIQGVAEALAPKQQQEMIKELDIDSITRRQSAVW